MKGFLFPIAQAGFNTGAHDWAGDDIRGGIIMEASTLTARADAEFVGDLSPTDLDECDGSSYARVAIADRATAIDVPTKATTLLAETVNLQTVFAAFGAGSRRNIGLFFYKHVGADNVNPLIGVVYGTPYFPWNAAPNGAKFIWNAAGVFRYRNRSA